MHSHSSYRLPPLIHDLAIATDRRGVYTVSRRLLGEGENVDAEGIYTLAVPSHLVRTTYVTPSFIVGALTQDPTRSYTRINEQNRWFGAIFAAQEEARIFVEAAGAGFSDNTYYDLRGVHHGGTIIAQLGVDAWRAHKIRVYIWPQAKPLARAGWLFVQFAGSHPAFAAVKPVTGDFRPASQAGYYESTSPAAPVIIQVARPSVAVPDFPAFVDAVLANGFHVTGDWVRYTDLETGVEIAWDQSQSRIARVAGKE